MKCTSKLIRQLKINLKKKFKFFFIEFLLFRLVTRLCAILFNVNSNNSSRIVFDFLKVCSIHRKE